jgi:hypothetical protein
VRGSFVAVGPTKTEGAKKRDHRVMSGQTRRAE